MHRERGRSSVAFEPDCRLQPRLRGLPLLHRARHGRQRRRLALVEDGEAGEDPPDQERRDDAGRDHPGRGPEDRRDVEIAVELRGVVRVRPRRRGVRLVLVGVVGGMGNLGGSIAASIFVSLLESYASLWVSPAQAVIVSFVVLILTLLFRPTGLFIATPKVARAALPSIGPVFRSSWRCWSSPRWCCRSSGADS